VSAEPEALETLRVEAGLPEFGKDIDENRQVMEVGRTEQAISYTKGCFLGQEPIVMARDRGQVNRMLMGVKAAGEPLTPGAKLYQGETEVGLVASSVYSPRLDAAIALAYLRRNSQTPGLELRAFPPSDGRAVTVATLPFVD
jgi:folate-binding protein YgfZ